MDSAYPQGGNAFFTQLHTRWWAEPALALEGKSPACANPGRFRTRPGPTAGTAAAVTALVLAVSACGGSGEEGTVQLRFSWWGSDERQSTMNEVIANFEADNPGITRFLKVLAMADRNHLHLAPHFAMEIHVHLAAAYRHEPWVEHFEWLDPLFEEHLEIADGRMHLSGRPGLGITPSERTRGWTVETHEEAL